MGKEYFIELLRKYLSGQATIEEEELIISYYNLFENDPDVLDLLNSEEKGAIKEEIYSAVQRNIAQLENHPARVRWMPGRAIGKAAACILIIAGIYALNLLNNRTTPGPNVISPPADKKQNLVFHLPDGSMVILNYGSKLHYAPDFNRSVTRDVYLEGQAYFDIHHNPDKPFIVHTDKVTTTVFGTAFNVKAVKGEQRITITVTRGKVKVSDQNKILGSLTPGQQIVYDRIDGNIVKSTTGAGNFMQWKDQEDLVIENLTFEETAKILEDKFNVTISFKDSSLKNSRFSTVLLKMEKLDHLIQTICDFNGAVWVYDKEKTAIRIDKKETQ